MATFEFNDDMLSIVDEHNHRVELGLQETNALLHWVADNQELQLRLSQSESAQGGAGAGSIEIHLLPQLTHLDDLKAAIPDLQQHPYVATSFVAPVDSVSQRALLILKEFQIEYKIHPLLEDSNEFAQG